MKIRGGLAMIAAGAAVFALATAGWSAGRSTAVHRTSVAAVTHTRGVHPAAHAATPPRARDRTLLAVAESSGTPGTRAARKASVPQKSSRPAGIHLSFPYTVPKVSYEMGPWLVAPAPPPPRLWASCLGPWPCLSVTCSHTLPCLQRSSY